MKVFVIIVTYNRKELLRECLEAINAQTMEVTKMLIIDNHSTDDTFEFIKENKLINAKTEYVYLDKNIGGAGGFSTGIKKAYMEGADWIWIMDDDTIPEINALEKLFFAQKILPDNVSFLCSNVCGQDKKCMNTPSIDTRKNENGCEDWNNYLEKGYVKIKSATFVSLLVSKESIARAGLPCEFFFIWGDDTEYTLRLTKDAGPAYLIGNSYVLHKRESNREISIATEENRQRIPLYFYSFRNRFFYTKEYFGKLGNIKLLYMTQKMVLKCFISSKYKFLKIAIIYKSVFSYYFNWKNRSKYKKRKHL